MKDKDMKDKDLIIYYRESLLQSILADIFTWGIFIGVFYFNYRFMGNGLFIKVVLVILWLVMIYGKVNSNVHKFRTKEELKKYIEEDIK